MKFIRSFSFASIFILLFDFTAFGQFWTHKNSRLTSYFTNEDIQHSKTQKWSLPGLRGDKQYTVYRPAAPYLSQPVNTTALQGDSYWMGSVTTQSYNQGKIGRFYYWDIQGNLRGSNLFLDIAGKNRRGLKLVFPRHKAMF